jgi:hypothetical protein
MRGRSRESEPVETPPHRAELWFSSVPCRPLPARGARSAAWPYYFCDGLKYFKVGGGWSFLAGIRSPSALR